MSVEILPLLLRRLHERHPELLFEVELSNTPADLLDQHVDIAFRMHRPRRQGLVDHGRWRRSGAVETLVGDWHSHPASSSAPSRTDHSAWRALVRSTGLPMIGLIDAGAPTPSVFLAVDRRRSVGAELTLREREADALVFGSCAKAQ